MRHLLSSLILLFLHSSFISAQSSYITAIINGQTVSWIYTGAGVPLPTSTTLTSPSSNVLSTSAAVTATTSSSSRTASSPISRIPTSSPPTSSRVASTQAPTSSTPPPTSSSTLLISSAESSAVPGAIPSTISTAPPSAITTATPAVNAPSTSSATYSTTQATLSTATAVGTFRSRNGHALTIGLAAGVPLLALLVVGALLLFRRRRHRNHHATSTFSVVTRDDNDTEKPWPDTINVHGNREPTLPVIPLPAADSQEAVNSKAGAAGENVAASNPFITPQESRWGGAPVDLPVFVVADEPEGDGSRPWVPPQTTSKMPVAAVGYHYPTREERDRFDFGLGRSMGSLRKGQAPGQTQSHNGFQVTRRPVGSRS